MILQKLRFFQSDLENLLPVVVQEVDILRERVDEFEKLLHKSCKSIKFYYIDFKAVFDPIDD